MLRPSLRGFTLIEITMTIVIIGVIGASLAVFMKPALDSYFAANRRALMTEGADIVARRIERELQAALPNSIINPAGSCLLFIPIVGGGRYRIQEAASGLGDILDFSTADSSFDVIAGEGLPPAAGTQVVIYNTGEGNSDAYAGLNRAAIDTASATRIVMTSPLQFPVASPGNRFHLVAARTDVYACAPDQRLYRFSVTGIPSPRPTTCPAIPADAAVFANGVSACTFGYSAADGLILLALGLSAEGETLMLQHEIHVDNHP